jgi:hypothetical protein
MATTVTLTVMALAPPRHVGRLKTTVVTIADPMAAASCCTELKGAACASGLLAPAPDRRVARRLDAHPRQGDSRLPVASSVGPGHHSQTSSIGAPGVLGNHLRGLAGFMSAQ